MSFERIQRGIPNIDVVPETIKIAAIRYEGEIFTGSMHFEAYQKLRAIHPESSYKEGNIKDGFLTSTGRFVDRTEALEIAERMGQAKEGAGRKIKGGLSSEELE